MLRVGFVRPVKMLLNVPGETPMNEANTCWVMCWLSIIFRILSFMALFFLDAAQKWAKIAV